MPPAASRAQPLTRLRRIGKARAVGPGARRPASGRKPTRPSWKGVGSMDLRTLPLPAKAGALAACLLACLLACLVAGTAPALAATPAAVTVRVEGLAETKLPATAVTTTAVPVVKDSNPAHACSGTSALGALELATAGGWEGPWNAGFGQYEIYSVL